MTRNDTAFESSAFDLVPTEQINPRTTDIDLLDSTGILQKINAEDTLVSAAVQAAIPQITVVVDKITEAFLKGGRLFYVGAGTSGRLGVLDASECPPTYGADPDMVQALIAGGEAALRNAIEGAEDNADAGKADLMNAGVTKNDVVVGISASGGAPYVNGAILQAKQLGCFTAGVTCNANSALAKNVSQAMVTEVGPEVIAGSTRMKAGTAQKLVLNMLTTASMIQIGKTYENLMVDVQPTNQKLRERATRMVAALAGCNTEQARQTLESCEFEVKTAVVMIKQELDADSARQRLTSVSGKLRVALNTDT